MMRRYALVMRGANAWHRGLKCTWRIFERCLTRKLTAVMFDRREGSPAEVECKSHVHYGTIRQLTLPNWWWRVWTFPNVSSFGSSFLNIWWLTNNTVSRPEMFLYPLHHDLLCTQHPTRHSEEHWSFRTRGGHELSTLTVRRPRTTQLHVLSDTTRIVSVVVICRYFWQSSNYQLIFFQGKRWSANSVPQLKSMQTASRSSLG